MFKGEHPGHGGTPVGGGETIVSVAGTLVVVEMVVGMVVVVVVGMVVVVVVGIVVLVVVGMVVLVVVGMVVLVVVGMVVVVVVVDWHSTDRISSITVDNWVQKFDES